MSKKNSKEFDPGFDSPYDGEDAYIKVRFQTQYDRFNVEEEVNEFPSETVPDMAMSIPEIMMRFTTGRPVPNTSNMLSYHGDDYYPDTRSMDLVEKSEMIEANRERIKNLQKEVDEKLQHRKNAAKQKREKLERLLQDDDNQPDKDSNKKDIDSGPKAKQKDSDNIV